MDDMSAIKPFEGATNRTAVVLAEKGSPTKYPVSVGYWRKRRKGSALPESAELSQVTEQLCRMSQWTAEPIDEKSLSSPWIAGRPKSVRAVKRIIGPSKHRARAGTCTWLNGAYWVEVVATRSDNVVVVSNCGSVGKKKQKSVERAVERDSVFSLLRGQDVKRWKAHPSLNIVMAQCTEADGSQAISEEDLKRTMPLTYRYFSAFEGELRSRSGYLKYLQVQPFYAIYNCGKHAFSPWKVVWREVANGMDAAVVRPGDDGRLAVPDHTLVFIPVESEVEAYMLSALLNSAPSRFIVQAYVSLHPSPHVMRYIPLPEWDAGNEVHMELSEAGKQAHEAARTDDMRMVAAMEEKADYLAARLWGLTRAELKDIQDSLHDLNG